MRWRQQKDQQDGRPDTDPGRGRYGAEFDGPAERPDVLEILQNVRPGTVRQENARQHSRQDGPAAGPRITLIGKPGCHLCDDAREVVGRVAEDLAVDWVELDINQDQDLAEKYWEKIPVILVDGRPHDFWRVDEQRLRAAVG